MNVTPSAWVGLVYDGASGGSPWNVTYWGNLSSLSGGPAPLGNDTVVWTFYDIASNSGNSVFWAYGPTTGSPVWREYYLNATGGWGVAVAVSVVQPDGVTIATNFTDLLLYENYSGSGNPSLSIQVTPDNGSAPLHFNLQADFSGGTSPGPYEVEATAYLGGYGDVWWQNLTNVTGTDFGWGTSGVLSQSGDYRVNVNVLELLGGNWDWVAGANQSVVVTPSSSGSGPTLDLISSRMNGTAPLNLTLTVWLTGYNGSLPLQLDVEANLSSGGTLSDFGLVAWNGTVLGIPFPLDDPGNYTIGAQVRAGYAWTNSTWVASASLVVDVLPPTSPAPVLSFSATPGNGTAPLNVTLDFAVTGGTSPFDLEYCVSGPFAAPNASTSCSSASTVQQHYWWNGTSLSILVQLNASGNYTINAWVYDLTGRPSSAQATLLVTPPPAIAPLAARASYVAPSAVTTLGATYGFVTTVTGGVAPYDIQWAFGDGTSGSAVAGATARHTYTVSGTYVALLTVTDARGQRATATVGPLVVAIPLAAGTTPWWASTAVLGVAALIGILSAAILVGTMQRLSRRREALNWLRELEERRSTNGSGSEPK